MDAGGEIAEIVGLSQNRVSEIIGNTKFGEIDNLLSQRRDMDYIARHYHMDLAMARPPRLSARPPWLKPHDPPVIASHWLAGLGPAFGRKNRPGEVQRAWLGTSYLGSIEFSRVLHSIENAGLLI